MAEYFYLAECVNDPGCKTNGIVEADSADVALEKATKEAEHAFDYVNVLVIQLNKVS